MKKVFIIFALSCCVSTNLLLNYYDYDKKCYQISKQRSF